MERAVETEKREDQMRGKWSSWEAKTGKKKGAVASGEVCRRMKTKAARKGGKARRDKQEPEQDNQKRTRKEGRVCIKKERNLGRGRIKEEQVGCKLQSDKGNKMKEDTRRKEGRSW